VSTDFAEAIRLPIFADQPGRYYFMSGFKVDVLAFVDEYETMEVENPHDNQTTQKKASKKRLETHFLTESTKSTTNLPPQLLEVSEFISAVRLGQIAFSRQRATIIHCMHSCIDPRYRFDSRNVCEPASMQRAAAHSMAYCQAGMSQAL
jgi:hypothetical protein